MGCGVKRSPTYKGYNLFRSKLVGGWYGYFSIVIQWLYKEGYFCWATVRYVVWGKEVSQASETSCFVLNWWVGISLSL